MIPRCRSRQASFRERRGGRTDGDGTHTHTHTHTTLPHTHTFLSSHLAEGCWLPTWLERANLHKTRRGLREKEQFSRGEARRKRQGRPPPGSPHAAGERGGNDKSRRRCHKSLHLRILSPEAGVFFRGGGRGVTGCLYRAPPRSPSNRRGFVVVVVFKGKRKVRAVSLKAGEEKARNMTVFLEFAFLAALLAHISCNGQRRAPEAGARRYNRIQHGQCTYTFILPEQDGNCRESTTEQYNTNALQRDAPHVEQDFSSQKLQRLEHVMDNYTQWLQKLESYIVENMKSEMAQLQQNAVQNHTATMLEIGTSLLSQTAEQTRKLTDVETQVLNQTSRLEIQLLENSLSTYKLEKQLLQQTHEILKIHEKNSLLEHKILEMEERHKGELDTLKEEKENLQGLVLRQSYIIQELERQLSKATTNNSILQKQQLELMDTVHSLVSLCSKEGVLLKNAKKEDDKPFRDCADAYQAGFNKSGVYSIYINNVSEPKKVFCNMEIAGGGWTVIQHREDGSLDFQKNWKEYKMGFGSPSGEYWLGNEFIFTITSQRHYSLRIELMDWEGNRAYSQYDRFYIGNEKQNYRLYLKGHSGTAGKQSSLILHGADFSTKDADNDNCMCKCALMLTGGWWFDACGPSNLNGMFYSAGQHHGKINGIKWHYFKGPSYSLRSTAMMIRPLDF